MHLCGFKALLRQVSEVESELFDGSSMVFHIVGILRTVLEVHPNCKRPAISHRGRIEGMYRIFRHIDVNKCLVSIETG